MAERVVFSKGDGAAGIRKLVIFAALLMAVGWIGCSSVKRIDAGHVGVRIKLAGDARGVQDSPTVQGWVFFNPLTEQIVQFPTSVMNIVWTASSTEGMPHDDSITFSSKEGASVNADIGIAFHIEPSLAPKLFARFRQTDMKVLANGFIRNLVREAFNEKASQLPVQDVYGAKKTQLVAEVAAKVREALIPEGIVLDQLTINGALRLPENVVGSINRALEATQNAIQAENRVRQIRAEAEQAIASAEGAAEAARKKATGDADAVLIRAKSEARANEILRLSMSPTVLAYRQIERWDGRLPVYIAGGSSSAGGGGLPMMTIDVSKLPEVSEAERRRGLAEALGSASPAPGPSVLVAPSASASR